MKDDLAQNAPLLSRIGPDDCHNGHSCPISEADGWLREVVALIMQSQTLVVAPGMSHFVSNRPYNHYSLLATIEDLLGVARLGEAASPMDDLVGH